MQGWPTWAIKLARRIVPLTDGVYVITLSKEKTGVTWSVSGPSKLEKP